MPQWKFLSNHGRALLCIARDPDARLRQIADTLDITERSAYSIVADLVAGGHVTKQKRGRRNRYEIIHHLALSDPRNREQPIEELFNLLARSVGTTAPTSSVSSGGPMVAPPPA